MPPEIIRFAPDGQARWVGMGDFVLVSPDGTHRIDLAYIGEPPHGDSYHRATIDGVAFPGEVWGCLFAFSTSGGLSAVVGLLPGDAPGSGGPRLSAISRPL